MTPIALLVAVALLPIVGAVVWACGDAERRRLQRELGKALADLHAQRAHGAGLEQQNAFLRQALRLRDQRDYAEGPLLEQREPRVH